MATAKKSTAKKSTAKKSTAKKSTAKKSTAKKTATVPAGSARTAENGGFPFLFLNHGPLLLESITKGGGAYIGFVAAPRRVQLEAIIERCPAPIRGDPCITGNLFSIESPGDVFDWMMLETYGTEEEKAASVKENWATFGEETAVKHLSGYPPPPDKHVPGTTCNSLSGLDRGGAQPGLDFPSSAATIF